MRPKMPENIRATLYQISEVARERPRHRLNDISRKFRTPMKSVIKHLAERIAAQFVSDEAYQLVWAEALMTLDRWLPAVFTRWFPSRIYGLDISFIDPARCDNVVASTYEAPKGRKESHD